MHTGNEACKQGIQGKTSPEVQKWGISGPTERNDVLQTILKELVSNHNTLLAIIAIYGFPINERALLYQAPLNRITL